MSIVFSPFSFQYLIKVEFFTFSPTTSCLFPSRARGFPFLPFPTCQHTHLPLGQQGIPGAFQTTFHIRLQLFHYILYNSWLDTWMNALPLPCSVSFLPSVTISLHSASPSNPCWWHHFSFFLWYPPNRSNFPSSVLQEYFIWTFLWTSV